VSIDFTLSACTINNRTLVAFLPVSEAGADEGHWSHPDVSMPMLSKSAGKEPPVRPLLFCPGGLPHTFSLRLGSRKAALAPREKGSTSVKGRSELGSLKLLLMAGLLVGVGGTCGALQAGAEPVWESLQTGGG
jgi:hypothetical protein